MNVYILCTPLYGDIHAIHCNYEFKVIKIFLGCAASMTFVFFVFGKCRVNAASLSNHGAGQKTQREFGKNIRTKWKNG